MNKDYPRVSLIIATFNWENALNLVFRSALEQTIEPDEIIIADDGSGPDTKDLIESFKLLTKIPIIHSWQKDEGYRLAMSRNKAISIARHDYVIVVDGDCVLHPHFIHDHIINANENCFCIGSRSLLSEKITTKAFQTQKIDVNFFSAGLKNRKNILHSDLLAKLFTHNTLNYGSMRGCNMAFWKKDVIKVNGFNEDFISWGREDSEFAVRMLNAGVVRKNIKFNALVYHLYHIMESRENLKVNNNLLNFAIKNKMVKCSNGISKYFNNK